MDMKNNKKTDYVKFQMADAFHGLLDLKKIKNIYLTENELHYLFYKLEKAIDGGNLPYFYRNIKKIIIYNIS